MRISDWSSDVCSSDLHLSRAGDHVLHIVGVTRAVDVRIVTSSCFVFDMRGRNRNTALALFRRLVNIRIVGELCTARFCQNLGDRRGQRRLRSEEHTSELQSLMRISYAVFCLKKKNQRYKRQ